MNQSTEQSGSNITQRLIQAARIRKSAAKTDVEAVDYDWSKPYCFTCDQLGEAGRFAEKAAGTISESLSELLGGKINMTGLGVSQHYASRLAEVAADTSSHVEELVVRGNPAGVIVLNRKTADTWVGMLLGGSNIRKTEGAAPSALELALLLDIFAAFSGGLASAFLDAGLAAPTHGDQILPADYAPAGDKAEIYIELPLNLDSAEGNPGASVIVSSSLIESIMIRSGGKQKSREENRKDMLSHIRRVPIIATATLGSTQISARDLMALEKGDVILLPNKLNDTGIISVQDQPVLKAFPAMFAGHYAMQVKDRLAGR